MSELRQDPLSGHWVIFAPERAERPVLIREEAARATGMDPFAEGNEAETPGELYADREPGSRPDGPGWHVRVVPNRYPAITRTITTDAPLPGYGSHEVIIECPQSESDLWRLDVLQFRRILRAYQSRLRVLRDDPRIAAAIIFKNHGPAAGATVGHSHSQLMATSFTPPAVIQELAALCRHFAETGRDYFADLLERELAAGQRIVSETDRFVVLCPYASRVAFEMTILPRRHCVDFDAVPSDDLDEFAEVLQTTLRRIAVALDNPPYNFVLQTAPYRESSVDGYCWRMQILPRLGKLAGYEWGTGCYVNAMLPEAAAEILCRATA